MAFIVEKVSKITEHVLQTGSYVYTCPADRCALIKFLLGCNVDGTNDVTISVAIYDSYKDDSSSAGMDDHFYMNKTITIPAKAALKPLGDCAGMMLLPGDSIYAEAGADDDVDLVGAVLEYGLPSGQSS